MTAPPSPPSRRRRRIVVAVAVLVLGLAWWLWPRQIDQRFVGTWSMSPGEVVTTDHFAPGGTIRFDSSDRGSVSDTTDSDQRFLWRVYDGKLLHLIFIGNADRVLPELRLRLRRSNLIPFYKDSFGYSLGTGEYDLYYDLVDAEKNVIRLSGPKGRKRDGREGTLTLRRVTDAP